MTALRAAIVAGISRHCFYGWAIVLAAGAGIFASGPGQSHTFSVFVEPVSRDLGISSATIATAYGLATLAAAFLLPQMGKLIDRYGPRRMLLVIVLLLGCACLLFGAAANMIWLALGFTALRFFGQGSLMLGCANVVSHWFSRSRGFAMSLMALGFGVSMAIHPPLSQFLVEAIGWRQAWVVLGASTWLLMLPVVLLLIHDRPEPLGLRPDGAPITTEEPSPSASAEIGGLTLREALRHPSFAILGLSFFGVSMTVTILHFYQVAILGAQGLGSEISARIFPVSAITMVLCMPFVGRLFDRVRTRWVIALGLLVTALSPLAITFVTSLPAALLYALIFGLNNAFSMTMFGYIWPRFFGRRHLGAIQGHGQLIAVIGASVGPLPIGLAFDLTGDPTWALRLVALYPLIAAFVVLAYLRTPKGVTGHEHLE